MIELTPRAQQQVKELSAAYVKLERPEAIRNLVAAVAEASRLIDRNPAVGLPAPRPYPALARPEQAWIKVGPYWIRYRFTAPLAITGVFHERADIPGRA